MVKLFSLLLFCLVLFITIKGKYAKLNNTIDCTQYNANCDSCLKASPSCHYCYMVGFDRSRCNTLENLDKCDPMYLEVNSPSLVSKNQDLEFLSKGEASIQLKPQSAWLNLTVGMPVNLTFEYRPAENYPLDLYYLMDLTYSMKDDLETLKMIGSEFGKSLNNITSNYRLAFGSYVDKISMPFYDTSPEMINNPCYKSEVKECAKGYLFKHIQNFTNDIALFVEKIEKKTKLSANVDNLEGGVEALWQVLVCNKSINWNTKSRKIIVVPTQGQMHMAGDGILAGAVKRITDLCMMDKDGNLMESLLYDYPSIQELHNKLKEKKVNLLFAATKDVFNYYSEFQRAMKSHAFVGILQDDSKNIIQLVGKGYNDFFKRIHFLVSEPNAPLSLKFFRNCDNVTYEEGGNCDNIEPGKTFRFRLQLELLKETELMEETISITEQSLNENITLHIKYFGKCKCLTKMEQELHCVHGDYRCGECYCHEEWSGNLCNISCSTDINLCRKNIDGALQTSCSGRGTCSCGNCTCDFPFNGDFCEYTCPEKGNKICSGLGKCVEGECVCQEGFSGEYCDCSTNTDHCLALGKICNNHGQCKCNTCKCKPNYFGQYCEKCTNCTGYCSDLNKYAKKAAFEDVRIFTLNETKGTIDILEDTEEIRDRDNFCFIRENNCEIIYEFFLKEDEYFLRLKKTCFKVGSATTWIAVIVGTILLAGLLALIAWKSITTIKDRKEWVRFNNEAMNAPKSDLNPLYESPIMMYEVPASLKKLD